MTSRCSSCRRDLDIAMFYGDNSKTSGISSYCKSCHSEASKQRRENPEWLAKRNQGIQEWKITHPDRVRSYNIKHKESNSMLVTREQYNEMMNAQEFKCAICKDHQQDKARAFAVDHDHKTGLVRRLLCINCNLMLGQARERIDVLEAAIQYLKDHQ